ncbi:MAG TPA: response regulator [Rhizomicrobium sp.]|jgi:FixJ family two-component response regulator|nr:response regulator [Rhizomicrobium sp.]
MAARALPKKGTAQGIAARNGSVHRRGTTVVAVVDDDPAFCASMEALLSSVGLETQSFPSESALQNASASAESFNVLVIDVRLPDRSGIELYEDLVRIDGAPPAIFISGYSDARMAVRAMKAGALDFFSKPFDEQELLDAILQAARIDEQRRHTRKMQQTLHSRFQTLTARERELMAHVISGRRNKEIAAAMGVTDITVKAHRNQVMKKMAARSVAALIGMAQLLGHSYADALALIPEGISRRCSA